MARRRKAKTIECFEDWLASTLLRGSVELAAFVYWRWQYREERFDRLIQEVASKCGADKPLVKAVICPERKIDDDFGNGLTHGG